MFGQLNKCHSLREIDMVIDQSPEFLADIGLSQNSDISTMSDVIAKRDYRVFDDIYHSLSNDLQDANQPMARI